MTVRRPREINRQLSKASYNAPMLFGLALDLDLDLDLFDFQYNCQFYFFFFTFENQL